MNGSTINYDFCDATINLKTVSKMLTLISMLSIATSFVIGSPARDHQIPVTIPTTPLSDGSDPPHSPVLPVAQGYFDLQSNYLSLSFLQSVGICTITITNTSNEFYVENFNSDLGTCQIALSGTPSLYTVSILTGNGITYEGGFIVF